MGEHVRAGELDIWTEQVGEGSDVLLIGGLGDTVESWQFQLDGLADRYRLTAFDNRGAGRTAMPESAVSVEAMADDAAAVLCALDVRAAHVAGFSGGSVIAQELALRHPQLVRSLALQSTWPVADPYLRSWARFVRWLVEVAPSERAFLEGFFLGIYTVRAHNAPTLVLAGGRDMTVRPALCRAVAELIPGAQFEVLEEEAHQPFQEVPDEWNARVDAFWCEVEARG
jgi:pimeloyl-ACP methyl ester carboxylesterase